MTQRERGGAGGVAGRNDGGMQGPAHVAVGGIIETAWSY